MGKRKAPVSLPSSPSIEPSAGSASLSVGPSSQKQPHASALRIALDDNHLDAIEPILKAAHTSPEFISAALLYATLTRLKEADTLLLGKILQLIEPHILRPDVFGQNLLQYAVQQVNPQSSSYPQVLDLVVMPFVDRMQPHNSSEILTTLSQHTPLYKMLAGQTSLEQIGVFKEVVANRVVEHIYASPLPPTQKIDWLKKLTTERFFAPIAGEVSPPVNILQEASSKLAAISQPKKPSSPSSKKRRL